LIDEQYAGLGLEKVDELEKAHAVSIQDRSNTLREVVAELHADGQAKQNEQGQLSKVSKGS
jgi:hypothetical protein